MPVRPIMPEDLMHDTVNWASRAVSWTVATDSRRSFAYYASYVSSLQLWFLTGPADYHNAKPGITTEELLKILNSSEVESVWVSTNWKQVGF